MNPARYRILGRTRQTVFEVGFGGCAIGGDGGGWSYGPTDDQESLRAIEKALSMGCTFFDTADVYGFGWSEHLLGQVLRQRRSAVLIATKAGYDFYHGAGAANFDPAHLRFALEQSLRRLDTPYVDVYQLHNPPATVISDPRTAEALDGFRRQGKIHWLGVSARKVADALAAVRTGWYDTVQVKYNLLAQEAAQELFPLAAAREVGIIVREPLANGWLAGKHGPRSRFAATDFRSSWNGELVAFLAMEVDRLRTQLPPGVSMVQQALRFVLAAKAVSVVIPGCKTDSQVAENLG